MMPRSGAGAVTVQRNAAGSLRVSLKSLSLHPPRLGARGLKWPDCATVLHQRAETSPGLLLSPEPDMIEFQRGVLMLSFLAERCDQR